MEGVQRCYPDHLDAPDDDALALTYGWPDSSAPTGRNPGTTVVRANMIQSLDGGIAIAGRSGGLGNAADERLFALLRDLADVILVGSGTAGTEGYAGVRLSRDRAERRARWGFSGPTPVAVVTRRGLHAGSKLLTDTDVAPIVITTTAGARRMAGQDSPVLAAAKVIAAGDGEVDLGAALGEIGALGLRRVQCEGGPELLGSLASADLIDELCLTTSPLLLGSSGDGILGSAAWSGGPTRWSLASAHLDESLLFAHYRRAR